MENIYYFYRESQPLYNKTNNTLNIQFIRYTSLEVTKDLENCLLVFDDSCEEIYNENEFVKLATSGRHRQIHVIFVKHNLFHQSKNSRTIDLNTSHIILFKSPRDIQQIDILGKQLNKLQFIREAYKLATYEPFGHLLIDLSPNVSDCLRFASNITEPGPSVFYLEASKAFITSIANETERAIYAEANAKRAQAKATSFPQGRRERTYSISM